MAKVLVYHRGVGCDTGCCGHAVSINGEEEELHYFATPARGQSARAFAEELVTQSLGPEHVQDLDWDNCIIVDDCPH